GKAIVMAGLTAIVGYGSFALSHYPGLRSIGYASTFGIGLSGLAAITLLPAILVMGHENEGRNDCALLQHVVRGRTAIDVLLVLGGSALIALAAQIAIPLPFTPVPLTMQPLAVLLVGIALGATRGAAAATLYLLEGIGGLPVFAQGHGGALWLIGPTAGYLYSYPAAAWLAGWFSERGWGSTVLRSVAGMLAALALIYVGGWAW